MRLSLWPNLNQPYADLLSVAQFADSAGFDTIYAEDHFMGSSPRTQLEPLLEVTAALSALAAATSRIRLGTLVLSVTYRHPAVIANWAATLDHVSNGRLTLGLGAGWQELEHDAYGMRLGPPGERVDRFVEGLQVVRGLLTQDRINLAGRYYQLDEAVCEPKPIQSPMPILIGAKQNRMLGVVAQHADQWNMWADVATMTERAGFLDAACERIGRDPKTISRSTQAFVLVTDDVTRARAYAQDKGPRPALAGTAEQIAEGIRAYEAAGVDEFIVFDADLGRGAQREDALSAIASAIADLS